MACPCATTCDCALPQVYLYRTLLQVILSPLGWCCTGCRPRRLGTGECHGLHAGNVAAFDKQAIGVTMAAIGARSKQALELLGKEIGMFVGRREDDLAMTLRVMIDAPPDETREQWLARTARERGLPAPQLWVPQSGPLTEAIASRWCQRALAAGGGRTRAKAGHHQNARRAEQVAAPAWGSALPQARISRR